MKNLERQGEWERGATREQKRLETVRALEDCNWNMKAAAFKLKLTPTGLSNRIRAWKIVRE